MKEAHTLALKLIEGTLNLGASLEESLRRVNYSALTSCEKGYYHLYRAELLGYQNEYCKTLYLWTQHLQSIKKNEDNPALLFSDTAWWNIQLGDISQLLGYSPSSFYQKAHYAGQEVIHHMRALKDGVGILTHQILLAYLQLISTAIDPLPTLKDDLINSLEISDRKSPSLTEEAQAIILLLNQSKDMQTIKYHLYNAFTLHQLYLHKRRCKKLIANIEDQNHEN